MPSNHLILCCPLLLLPSIFLASGSFLMSRPSYDVAKEFELWCGRRPLRVPWTARRSNQSIPQEVSANIHWKDWCSSWSSNTLTTCAKSQLVGKDPDAGKYWGQEKKGATEDEKVEWHHDLMDMDLNKIWEIVRTGKPGVLQSMRSQRVGFDLSTEQQKVRSF